MLFLFAVALQSCDWFTGSVDPDLTTLYSETLSDPSDPLYAQVSPYRYQWPLEMIGMPRTWGILTDFVDSAGEEPVVIAVIDSGVIGNHPDLSGSLVPGYDFNRDTVIQDGITEADWEAAGFITGAPGSLTHGTHVAGVIAGRTQNGVGIAGMGWTGKGSDTGIKVMPLKILDFAPTIGTASGGIMELIDAILYASALPNESGEQASEPVDVINMSLGTNSLGSTDEYLLSLACSEAAGQGVILVAAAGNDAAIQENGVDYPAKLESVIAVASVDGDGSRSYFSDYGPEVEIAAPGGSFVPSDRECSILSTGIPDVDNDPIPGYARLEGTSMACPHVAAAFGILMMVNPDYNPQSLRNLIFQTAADLGDPGRDYEFGWGLIQIDEAVRRSIISGLDLNGNRSIVETDGAPSVPLPTHSEMVSQILSYLETAREERHEYIVYLAEGAYESDGSESAELRSIESRYGIVWMGRGSNSLRRFHFKEDRIPRSEFISQLVSEPLIRVLSVNNPDTISVSCKVAHR